jgi:hypothetical protein
MAEPNPLVNFLIPGDDPPHLVAADNVIFDSTSESGFYARAGQINHAAAKAEFA